MDWTKLNVKEVIYYCKSCDGADFDCGPLSLQIEELVLMFHHYGIEQFTVKDIQEFYEKMQNIKCIDEDTFQIVQAESGHFLPFDTSIYTDVIEKGYQTGIGRNRIEGYYEKYHDILNL